MDLKEIRTKSASEIERLLAEERERLRDLRFKVANGQLKDVRDIRNCRQTIARLLTHQRTLTQKKR